MQSTVAISRIILRQSQRHKL